MITLGNNKIAKMYLGATPVATSYLGSQRVYPNASLALSADLLAFAAAGGSQELTVAVEEGQMWALSVPVGWSASSQSGTGTATLTLTIDNNTTTVARSGALTVASEDLTATCALAQAAGAKSYGEISIGAYGYGVLPAGGGTVSPTLAYSQPWTWNGVNGSGGTITSGATVAYSGSGVDAATGTVSASTKGTTESGQTTVATATVSVSLNGKSAAKEAVVFQEANSATYGNVTPKNITVADIPASGGTISEGTLATDFTQTISYTSGATRPGAVTYVWDDPVSAPSLGTTIQNRTKIGSLALRAYGEGSKNTYKATDVYQAGNYVSSLAGKASTFSYGTLGAGAASISPTVNADGAWTFTFSSGATSSEAPSSVYGIFSVGVTYSLGSVQNGFTVVDASTGTLTGTARGTEIGNARTSGIVTRKVDGVWTPAAAYNAAGTKTTSASKTATCTQEANSITAYGTPTGRTLAVSDIPASGGTVSSGTLGGTITQSRTYTSGSTDSVSNPTVSASSYSAAISANNLGTTIKSKTSIGTLTYYYTCNGIQGSVSATVYQAANAATSITYGTPSVSLAVSDIPASGGSISSGTVTYSQSRTQNYTSGGTAALSALTSGGSVSYSAAVSAASLGTTIKARTSVGTLTATVTMSGKSGSGSAIVYQQANTFSDNSMKLHFGSFTGANTITVGAGSSSTAVYLEVTRLYTSGVYQSGYNVTTGGTFTVSGTGFSIRGSNVIAASRGTTAGAARSGTVTGKYSHLTATGTITQQENKVTNSNYNPRITAYGTPSVSIGSGITAAGGRATVTHSVTNTQTYNALYASGATGPDQTRSVAGTTTITLTGNGNSRFSLSGNIISHSSMGTNLTTDTVTVTATNSGQTSKTSSASKSVTNGRAVTGTTGGVTTYGHVTAGSIINKTIPASGGSATATAGSGSQAWSKTAMVTSYEYDSGATSDATIENASSGTNTISPSVGSITASAASKGTTVSGTTTVKSQAVTWSGGGSKSASGTMYIYQAANEVVVRNNFIITSFSYPNIVYSGGTVTPAATTVEYDAYYTSGATQTGYGLPPGGTLGYMSVSLPSGFSVNSTTGVVTAGANSSTSTRSATIRARVQYDGSIVASKDATVTQAGVPGPTRVNISINNPQLTGGEVVIAFSPACYDTLTILVMGYLQDGSLYSVYRNVGGGITEDRFYPNGAWADSASIENIDGEGIPPVTKTRGIYYW